MENKNLSVESFADEICRLPRRPSAADFLAAPISAGSKKSKKSKKEET